MTYEPGIIALIAALIILIKLPRGLLRKLLWMDVPIDILVTASFISLLHGTYSGLMTAIVAGLGFSLIMWIAKQFIGHERLRNTPDRGLHWEHIPGRFSR